MFYRSVSIARYAPNPKTNPKEMLDMPCCFTELMDACLPQEPKQPIIINTKIRLNTLKLGRSCLQRTRPHTKIMIYENY